MPRAAKSLRTSPVQPLLIFVTSKGNFKKAKLLAVDLQRLKNQKFPVETRLDGLEIAIEKPMGLRDLFFKWSRTVNRL